MADDTKFDEEKRKRAIKWINSKCPNLTCECCETKNWQLAADLVTPIIHSNGIIIGGATYPSFMLICKTCSNTKMFNAVASGVIAVVGGTRSPEKEDADAK